MASISSIGSSGLQAAQLRLNASANNVANMDTPNYRRQVVQQAAAADSAKVNFGRCDQSSFTTAVSS